jgi:hypothetical protein
VDVSRADTASSAPLQDDDQITITAYDLCDQDNPLAGNAIT